MKKVICVICLLMLVNTARARVVFDDGRIHKVDYVINDQVRVYNGPWNKSTMINIFGGSINGTLATYGSSDINIMNGLTQALYSYEDSRLTMLSGSISYLSVLDYSCVTIVGGRIKSDLHATGNSQIEIYGGSIGDHFFLEQSTTITIRGANFAIDGHSIDYGRYDTGNENTVYGRLTGVLANGEPIDNEFILTQDAAIVFAVPEPATIFILGLGILALRRNKR